MKKLHQLGSPYFLINLFLLALNDWCLKQTFHNHFTGKLSDFTGLFVFPFFWSVLFPQYTKSIHWFTVLLFVMWKSEYAQIIIDFANYLNFPLQRTIDFTDNIALLSVVFSYWILHYSKTTIFLQPTLQKIVMLFTCFSFIATSRPKGSTVKFTNINRTYHFSFSKRELIERFNLLQIKEIAKLNNLHPSINFDKTSNTFYYNANHDTIAVLLDYRVVKEQDTIRHRTSFSEIFIMGNDTISSLQLLNIANFVPSLSEKDYQKQAVKQFERRVIRKIQKL